MSNLFYCDRKSMVITAALAAWLGLCGLAPAGSAQTKSGLSPMERRSTAEAHLGHALDLQNRGELWGAVREYRFVLQLDNNYASAHNNLGNALDELGQTDEAIREYRAALDVMPLYASAHYNLAIVLDRKGALADAREHYIFACQAYPNRYCPAEQPASASRRPGFGFTPPRTGSGGGAASGGGCGSYCGNYAATNAAKAGEIWAAERIKNGTATESEKAWYSH
jgi:tetratricopeptide (TPR) repeat protein